MKRLTTLVVTVMLLFSLYSIDKDIDLNQSTEYTYTDVNYTDLPFEH